jgi:excisionase family DNA binding protein
MSPPPVANNKLDGFISVLQAAEILGISKERVHQLIRAGKLRALRAPNAKQRGRGHAYRIPVEDVLARQATVSNGPAPGAPRPVEDAANGKSKRILSPEQNLEIAA